VRCTLILVGIALPRYATETNPHPLIRSQPARGRCYVICFNPAHNLTIANLSTPPCSPSTHIVPIIQAWTAAYSSIPVDNPFVKYIQIFENKGSAMGCSNPHPHGQVWSLDYVPEEPYKALVSQWEYSQDSSNDREGEPKSLSGRPNLLLTYAQWEMNQPGTPRLVASNEDWVAVIPYWAVWPFEVSTPVSTMRCTTFAHIQLSRCNIDSGPASLCPSESPASVLEGAGPILRRDHGRGNPPI
jgi:UDPglucose--hexose-1-phosphate uridylyltransferase